jgi:hypothetical protein
VLCIFPAVYVVCIGSAVVAIYRGLSSSRRYSYRSLVLEVVMVNVAMMAVLGVLVVVYVLRRKSRLNDDV